MLYQQIKSFFFSSNPKNPCLSSWWVIYVYLLCFEISYWQKFNFESMRHLQQNTKFLERYMLKVHEELKMRIKFCKQKVTQDDLILMLLEYVDHQSTLLMQQHNNKENVVTGNVPITDKVMPQKQMAHHCHCQRTQESAKDQQIHSLKEQMRVEAQLTRNFFKQLKKEAVNESQNPLPWLSVKRSTSIVSPEAQPRSARASFVTTGFEPLGDSDKVLTSPKNLAQSADIRTSNSGRTSRITASYQQGRERAAEQERQKSKTFAKLRKVQALFCRETSKPLSRNKSMASQSWGVSSQENLVVAEQNLNLKAIQSNLVTHLSIMQKYKSVPSIEELVRKEQKLKRKEMQLRDLQNQLQKKERTLNLSQIEALKRQKSTKVL